MGQMETRRLALDERLRKYLGSDYVYFKIPEGVRMHYPCIKYELNSPRVQYADNTTYFAQWEYVCTFITQDPTDPTDVVGKLLSTEHAQFERTYDSDNLTHIVVRVFV